MTFQGNPAELQCSWECEVGTTIPRERFAEPRLTNKMNASQRTNDKGPSSGGPEIGVVVTGVPIQHGCTFGWLTNHSV